MVSTAEVGARWPSTADIGHAVRNYGTETSEPTSAIPKLLRKCLSSSETSGAPTGASGGGYTRAILAKRV